MVLAGHGKERFLMNRVQLARSDVKFLLFSELYVRMTSPKARRKAFNLLEAAISCYARKGFEAVTMEMIAREGGVSRAALSHYFKGVDEIRELSVKYIRLVMQKLAVDAMSKETDPEKVLSAYIGFCFEWVRNLRTHALVWLGFLHRCTGHTKLREINTLASLTGADRISNLIRKGISSGTFQYVDPQSAARSVQALITGSLIMYVSENIEGQDSFERRVTDLCLQTAGVRVKSNHEFVKADPIKNELLFLQSHSADFVS
jgi:AcrR family transcriptional regulator